MTRDDDTLPPGADDEPADLLVTVATRLQHVTEDLARTAADIGMIVGEVRGALRRMGELESRVIEHDSRIANLENRLQ